MLCSILAFSRRSILAKVLVAVVIVPTIATPAKAFGLELLVPAVSYLVGRGLINEARGAVQASIADADRRLEERIKQANQAGEERIAQMGEESRKSLKEAERIIFAAIKEAEAATDRQQQKVFDNAMKQQKFFFQQLDEQQARLFTGIHAALRQGEQALSDFADGSLPRAEVMVEEISKALPKANPLGGKPQYRLHSLIGDGVPYKTSGEYRFLAIGYGIGSESKDIKIFVNGAPVQPKRRQASACEFVVDVQDINHLFKDTEIMPIPVRLEGENLKASSTIWLFPRFPAKYRLTVEVAGKEQPLFIESPGPGFYEAEEAIIAKLKGDPKAARQRAGEIHNLMKTRLPFGDFKVEVPDGTKGYDLQVQWANGDRVTLSRAKTTGKGVAAIQDGKWLRIDIGPKHQ